MGRHPLQEVPQDKPHLHPALQFVRGEKSKEPSKNSSKSLHADIKVPPLKETVHPGDNFYEYCNGNWVYHTQLPDYRVSYSVSDEVEEYLDGFLFTIAKDCTRFANRGSKSESAHDRTRETVGRLVLSSMRPEKQKFGTEFLKRTLRNFSCMRDLNDVMSSFGRMIRYGISTILNVQVNLRHNFKEAGRLEYFLSIGTGHLGLPDPKYYLVGSQLRSSVILKKYKELLDFLTKFFDLNLNLADVIPIETEIAHPLSKLQDTFDDEPHSLKELRTMYPYIQWDSLLTAIGFTDLTHPKFGTIFLESKEWIKALNQLCRDLPTEYWQLLISAHTALGAIPYLPPPFDDKHFDLYGRSVLGQIRKIPQHHLTMRILKGAMKDEMSYLFTKEYLTAEKKREAEKLTRGILASAKKKVMDLSWLEEKTRIRVQKKIDATTISLYYSEPIQPPKQVSPLQSDNLLANIYLLNSGETDRYIQRMLNPVDIQKRWDEPAFTVNAYYYHELNQLVVPAGSFVWPFYKKERIGWSYGGVGAVIGHELIHGFDEEGKEYDEDGRMKSMWTTNDKRNYTRKLNELITLFNRAKLGGAYVNGKLTASENLADLGGLSIALDALKRELAGTSEQVLKKELRDFFISYAVSWRTKEREKKIVQSLYMDPHAPPIFRVNLIVAQFDEWYELFDVKTGHDLYIPPEERIRMF